MLREIDISDQRHLLAAQGWWELGNDLEAIKELEEITAEHRDHPVALEIRFQIHAKAKNWVTALDFASALAQAAPSVPCGWIHRS